MTYPDKIPETDEEIERAVEWCRQQGIIAVKQEFLEPETQEELRHLMRTQSHRIGQENFLFRSALFIWLAIVGGIVLLSLYSTLTMH